MRQFSLRQYFTLAADVVLLVICIINASSILERARPPFSVRYNDLSVVINEIHDSLAAGTLETGDLLLTWNSHEIVVPEILEFFGDLSSIGQKIEITVKKKNVIHTAVISLVTYYDSPRFLIVMLCVGCLTWLVGIFILFHRSNNPAADFLHWALVTLSISILST